MPSMVAHQQKWQLQKLIWCHSSDQSGKAPHFVRHTPICTHGASSAFPQQAKRHLKPTSIYLWPHTHRELLCCDPFRTAFAKAALPADTKALHQMSTFKSLPTDHRSSKSQNPTGVLPNKQRGCDISDGKCADISRWSRAAWRPQPSARGGLAWRPNWIQASANATKCSGQCSWTANLHVRVSQAKCVTSLPIAVCRILPPYDGK